MEPHTSQAQTTKDRLKVGVILSPHALKGEVKIYPTTDDPGRFKKGLALILDTGRELIDVEVERSRIHKQFVILKLKDYDRIEDVERFRKKELYVSRDLALPLKKDEYYIADLVGLSVMADDGSAIGTLTDVIPTGANDVYAVERPDGSELLIPAIRDCILSVDMEEGRILVHMLPGLMEAASK